MKKAALQPTTRPIMQRKTTHTLKLAFFLVFCLACGLFAADESASTNSLESARAQGRAKSTYLRDANEVLTPADGIPEANLQVFQDSLEPVLKKNCVMCHGPDRTEGRLRIDQLNPDLLSGPDVERWREVFSALSKSEMPPEDEQDVQLADDERARLVDWLSSELNKASLVRRNLKEASSFRRLTKYEYDYALQDLLGISYSLAKKLPPESTSDDGFKNSSDLLLMSAMQFETYREIAQKALRRAIVWGERPNPVTYLISMQDEMDKEVARAAANEQDKEKKKRAGRRGNQQQLFNRKTDESIPYVAGKFMPLSDDHALATAADPSVVLALPRSNELRLDLDRFLPDEGIMRVRIHVGRSSMNANEYASLRLFLSAHTSNDANFTQVISERDIPVTESVDSPQWIHFDVPLADIQRNPFRKLTTTFPRRDEFLHIHNVSNAAGGDDPLVVLIDRIEISAPFYEQWPPKSHTDIFIPSSNAHDEQAYGREILGSFLRRAWRRPVTNQDIDPLMRLFTEYRTGISTFEETMLEVLATSLTMPEFLYAIQRDGATDPSQPTTISDVEFASRLSLFLWSSIPDGELLTLAEQGRLREPALLKSQIHRLLADPRSSRFTHHFVEQWLGLDGLNSVTHLTDVTLRDAMREEPIAFFEEVLTHNRSIMDFLHSDYAVVNERLAGHYHIPNVYGPHFRKVAITPQSNRGGVLTCAAMLAMNSDGADSHPLKRGVWMLKRILQDPPPPPPPNVPEVDLTDPEILKLTLKERIVNHRSKPACLSCHSRIDPWGIAFENYDALGVFRTHSKDKPVDATSELFNGQTLAGIEGLKGYLLVDRQDQFARAMVNKLMAYALGRPLAFGDRADVDQVTEKFRRQGDGLADLVQLIITSPLFNAK